MCEYREKKPQVPPLRFAPVGMTIHCGGKVVLAEALCGHNRIVIPTGAKRSGGTCGFFSRVTLCQRLFMNARTSAAISSAFVSSAKCPASSTWTSAAATSLR